MSCSGKCCAVFPLGGRSLEDVRRRVNSIMDGAFILDMLVPLEREDAIVRAIDFDVVGELPDGPLFTCRHWDEDTRLCTVYDQRPRMCSEYPYSGACDHCGYRITDPAVWLRRWCWQHDAVPLLSRYSVGLREVERDRRLQA